MVFESLVNPVKAGKKPWEMFFIGLIYSSLAIMLGLYIFAEHASLVAIFLTVLAATPFMYTAIKIEEKKDLVYEEEAVLIKEHGKALSFFMFLFMGFVVSFSIWYVFLPEDVTFNVFSVQIKEIERVQGIDITGNAVSLVGIFGSIFFNNLVVASDESNARQNPEVHVDAGPAAQLLAIIIQQQIFGDAFGCIRRLWQRLRAAEHIALLVAIGRAAGKLTFAFGQDDERPQQYQQGDAVPLQAKIVGQPNVTAPKHIRFGRL